MSTSSLIKVEGSSHVGVARREASDLAKKAGLNETQVGKIALIVTELGTNLIKHAGSGEILLRVLAAEASKGIEVLSLDKGPGIKDIAKCLGDGYSTAGSSGTGLGAVSRLTGVFDIYSQPEQGTAIVAQLWAGNRTRERLEYGAICLPIRPGEACGDSWCLFPDKESAQVLLVDGLGHGPGAATAAGTAIRAFQKTAGQPLATIVQEMHAALRSTRGASLAVAQVDFAACLVRFLGVGNVACVLVSAETSRSTASNNGIVGYEMQSVKEFTYPRAPGETLIMHSDGLMSRWRLDKYPGVLARHPSILATLLYRDFRRDYDDITVLVLRDKPGR